jgi:hypothetical protein
MIFGLSEAFKKSTYVASTEAQTAVYDAMEKYKFDNIVASVNEQHNDKALKGLPVETEWKPQKALSTPMSDDEIKVVLEQMRDLGVFNTAQRLGVQTRSMFQNVNWGELAITAGIGLVLGYVACKFIGKKR